MKLDAMSAAALAVAGLAVYAWTKPKTAAPSSADAIYAQAGAQRQASGDALPSNTDYMKNWQGLSDVFASQPDFYV